MMKCIIVLIFTLVAIDVSTATEILYVLPDNSTNVASCPSQPCATLSQYLSDNGSLPVVSNVEYHFLPGEHHVPANLILQNLHNFSIIGTVSNLSSPVVLVGCLQWYVINIVDSHFVSINNVVFKRCSIWADNRRHLTNLGLSCCFSCKISNVTFMQYGIIGYNLIGTSYLHNIKFENSCQIIFLRYSTCPSWNNYTDTYMHDLMINQLLIFNRTKCSMRTYRATAGLYLHLEYTKYHMTILISNSHFHIMDQGAFRIKSGYSHTAVQNFFVTNSTFKSIEAELAISIRISPFNKNVHFVNCNFHNNIAVIRVSVEVCKSHECKLSFSNTNPPLNLTNIYFIRCQFINNSHGLLTIENRVPLLGKVNLLLESLKLSHNFHSHKTITRFNIILVSTANVHINGTFNVTKNHCGLSIMQLQSCDILFSGKIIFDDNYCAEVISLDTYIKVLEHTNIAITNNSYQNVLISLESAGEYYQPYPFCLFQYVAMKNYTIRTKMLTHDHYVISFSHNYKTLNNNNYIVDFNGSTLYSQTDDYSISLCHFLSHCKWLSSSPFYNQDPENVNKQIIQNDDKICDYLNHKHICYCSESREINCSKDILGSVYPGQMLKTSLCNKCSNDSTILYAEVHNINLPSSSCKIAHQSQLIYVIGNHSNTVNYTIASGKPDSERCELFLTASPFLNKIYDAFYVQLLPCPVGFTLQNGVCDCDPILPPNFVKCYIDHSAIRRPANTWITAHDHSQLQGNDIKYLISDCHMDYCLPYSSNVNLLYPDLQCQFNRTGILCSQCHHNLSMVFGSSRCLKCTNVHILITIIVIVAGIVLVVLLYLFNLTVTNGTINGIIFYANIISINDSVFLVNDNVFKPLRVFISFANLDLGIETCFYNGMDSYAKMWLQLFFPFYLIIIAASIIIASRYSSRILRLTYTRSLPVLATLFLLSYTGVLRTVLTVLFSYSTITHLPSGHQQIVWFIDASVPLFGLKFTILFITCLVLFLLLIPFNIILLFTRYLLQFRLINRFKPLLDAFQGSYKDKHYYWVGVHIILRSMFFALYGFQATPRLIIATLILIFFIGYHGYTHPYKNKPINIHELLLLINLTMMYAVSYQCGKNISLIVSNVMISLAFIQFGTILLYHFLTYTCQYNILNKLKLQMIKYITKKSNCQNLNYLELLDIPERTYNYAEYQDGLVSDDFG